MVRKETEAAGSLDGIMPMGYSMLEFLVKNKVQVVILVVLLVGLPFLGLFLYEFDSIFQMRVRNNPTYDWPKYSDLYLAVASAIIILIIFAVIQKLFTNTCMSYISPKYEGPERVERTERMIKSAFKGTYYIFSSVFALYISKDTYFMPPSLGGTGDADHTFDNYPYYDKSTLKYMKEYLMVQLGYHLSAFILLFTKQIRKDFLEMFLHHFITLFLLGLAYLMNYWPISLMILFVNDVSDAFVSYTRVFVDTIYSKIALVFYVFLMFSWVYMRLIVFPFELLRVSCYQNPKIDEIYGIGILGSMAHALVALNIYWFILLVNMGLRFLRTKEAMDTQIDLRHKKTS